MNGCPGHENRIWMYLFGEMDENQREAFADHLKRCLSCRSEYRRFEAMLEKVKTAGRPPRLQPQSAEAMAGRILKRCREKKGFTWPGRLRFRKRLPAVAAACALLLLVGVYTYRMVEQKAEAPMMTELQSNPALLPEQVEGLPDMELLMEFQTVSKIVNVMDADVLLPEDQPTDDGNSALRNRIHALDVQRG